LGGRWWQQSIFLKLLQQFFQFLLGLWLLQTFLQRVG
jgi:hypothetical protein